MRLDGFRETDMVAAAEKGVEQKYKFPPPYGPGGGSAKMCVRFKWIGAADEAYQNAMTELQVTTAENTNERTEMIYAALYDHMIIDWSTDVQSNGRDLAATKENFVGLVMFDGAPEITKVMLKVVADIDDRRLFVKSNEESLKGN